MPNPWFRVYSEFEDDPKVQMLSEAMQRRLVMLMCDRCKEEKLTDMQRAFKWRISLAEVAETKTAFMAAGFIDETWDLTNWNKRQFLSDSSTDRVRRYRSGLKQDETLQNENETLPKQADAVTVTPPDTDTDAETEEKHKEPAFAVPDWISAQTWKDFEEMRKKIRKPMTDKARRNVIAKLDEFRARGHDPDVVLNNSITNSWVGIWEPQEGANARNGNRSWTKSDANDEAARAAIASIMRRASPGPGECETGHDRAEGSRAVRASPGIV